MGRKAQITFDFLIAIMLVTVTVAGIVSIASGEVANARTFDSAAKLKILAVDLRDTVTQVYAAGDGFTVRKELPFELKSGEGVTITLNSTTNRVEITATLGGKTFKVAQKLQVPLYTTSSITLGPGERDFNVTAQNVGGEIHVILQG